MSEADRKRWEHKHHAHPTGPPRRSLGWLAAIAPTAPGSPRLALDLACGGGRHCGPLLEAGYTVVAADIARAALDKIGTRMPYARASSDSAGVLCAQIDIDDWPFAERAFDLIVQIDFLDRARFDDIKRSTRPGGLVLVDTFMLGAHAGADGPANPAYLLEPDELEWVFADWHMVCASREHGASARAAILAQRPR